MKILDLVIKLDLIRFILIFGIISLATGLIGEHIVYGIYEDQIIACNFEDKCVTIDIDDFMSTEKSDLLWNLYNNDLDTFSTADIGDISK